MAIAFAAEKLTVTYEKDPVLRDLTFQAPHNKLVAIIGPNGAGKSTLLKTALGLLHPIFGKIDVDTEVIGYVPQCGAVDWDFPMTVFDLVLMGCYRKRKYRFWTTKKERVCVEHALEQVGLALFSNYQISQLSCGQRQRAFLARALVQDCDTYFMDEPFAGIDASSSNKIQVILRELIEKRKSVFVVHHDLQMVRTFFDWALLINQKLIAQGPVDQVVTEENLARAYG